MILIDADELIEMIWRERVDSREAIEKVIRRQFTMFAVPVVRCGNCAKRGKNGKGIPNGCPFGMTDDTCDPNAYCSYGVLSMKTGERKDDE